MKRQQATTSARSHGFIVVDPVVNAASATFAVFVDVPNPGGAIPAGIRCTARLPA